MNELLKNTNLAERTKAYRAALFRQNLCKRDFGVKAMVRGSAPVCPVHYTVIVFLHDNEYLCRMGTVTFPYLERLLEKSA